MSNKHQPKSQRRWLTEAGVYAALFGIPLLVLFPYTPWRPDAKVRASLRTSAIGFTVGRDYRGKGLFSNTFATVVVDNFERLELPGDASPPSCRTVTFEKAQVSALLLMPDTDVFVEWDDARPRGARLVVHYAAPPPGPALQMFLDDRSKARCDDADLPLATLGAAKVYPLDLRLSLGVDPASADANTAAFKAEVLPPLAASSTIRFVTAKGDNAVLGFDATVDVLNADRKETVNQDRLEIGGLRDSAGTLQIKSEGATAGLAIELQATAGVLQIGGHDRRPSSAEVLRASKELSSWLTTAVLIGTAALTVLTRLKIVRLAEPKK